MKEKSMDNTARTKTHLAPDMEVMQADPLSLGVGLLLVGLFLPILLSLGSEPAVMAWLKGEPILDTYLGVDFQLRIMSVLLGALGLPGFFVAPAVRWVRVRAILWSRAFFIMGSLSCGAGVFFTEQVGFPMLGLFMTYGAAVSVGLFYIMIENAVYQRRAELGS